MTDTTNQGRISKDGISATPSPEPTTTPDNLDPDTTPVTTSRYARTLSELEAEAHIPLEDQIQEQATPPARTSSEAWDEERRQLRLAGGPM